MPKGGLPWNKTVFAIVDGKYGPLIFRGGRIDGTGRLKFGGDPVDPVGKGETLTSAGGISRTFYETLTVRVIDNGGFYLFPSTKGCYAVQVDSPGFQDVIIVEAS